MTRKGKPTSEAPDRDPPGGPAGPGSDGGGPRLEIVIHTSHDSSTHPLPRSGKVTLGRGNDVDIRVDDGSVSRRHAALYIGRTLRIEDLGSANGTRVRERSPTSRTDNLIDIVTPDPADSKRPAAEESKHRSMEIEPDDVILLGSAQVVVRYAFKRRDGAPARGPRAGVIVEDPALRSVYDTAERIAASTINVLVLGETGAGKEMVAGVVHGASPRARRAFLCLSCVAFPELLLESELFGHVRGAFTGAHTAKQGLLETADGGTVFLDEVGELPLSIQAKLLRVIEDRLVTRVGGIEPRRLDVRFVAATNKDLVAASARGEFRLDLYHRLSGMTLTVPPLRARPLDLEPLARHFAQRAQDASYPGRPLTIAPEALAALRSHPWPGNVRELRNVIERAVALSAGGSIQVDHLGLGDRPPPEPLPARPAEPAATPPPAPEAGLWRRADSREEILDALRRSDGNQTRAAELLGISRGTLIARLEEYGIRRPRKG